ncbi:MAG: lipase family protein [Bdellovibrionota bacterium]
MNKHNAWIVRILNLGLVLFLYMSGNGSSVAWADRYLLSARPVTESTKKALEISRQLLGISENLKPKTSVSYFEIIYQTLGVRKERVRASGLIVVPNERPDQPLSLLSYQHGTILKKTDVPSGVFLSPDAAAAGLMSSLGFVVVAADYLGIGLSDGFHPYLHAETEATASADLLRAAQEFLPQLKVKFRNEIYLLGYSQGGHATLALQHYLEATAFPEFHVIKSAPMAGPYALSSTVMSSSLDQMWLFHILYTIHSMNRIYGIDSTFSSILSSPYDSQISSWYDGSHSLKEITSTLEGKTLRDVVLGSFLSEIKSNPSHPFVQALRKNDVYDFKPLAPVRLYHGRADQTVPYENSEIAYRRMKSLGAEVSLINLGDSVTHGSGAGPAFSKALEWFLE